MSPVGYLAWIGGTVAALTVAIVTLTIATDPYRMFGTASLRGWTELKPRVYQQIGIAKAYQLERIVPRALILGNSRAEIGLDPTSSAWPSDYHPVFNAALAGGNVFTSLLMLRESMALQPPAMIVLGVDFLDFLTEPNPAAVPTETERRLLVDRSGQPNPARRSQIWKDHIKATLTIDAVADSIMTVIDQNPEKTATMTPLGFNPLYEYRVLVSRSGYRALFAQKNAIYRKQYAMYRKPDFTDPWANAAYRNLTSILQLASEHRIPMILYIHPYHADYLEMLYDLGLWSGFEEWKRTLVRAVERIEGETSGEIRLFDFSGFDAFSTEPAPAAGDRRTEMRWYWEPGHYKSALGEHILATIFEAKPLPSGRPQFGRVLTAASMEAVLGEIRKQRLRFSNQREAAANSTEIRER